MKAKDWLILLGVLIGGAVAIFAGTLLFMWLIDSSPIGQCYGEPQPGCPWYDGGT